MTQNVPPDGLPDLGAARAAGGDTVGHPPAAVDTLKQAMRRARADDAERSGVRAELRAARLGRLEMLQDALQPLVAQIPSDIDMFDVALVPSPSPRLFIDMIGFVEMGRDGRLYILNQDTRHGRILVAESESLDVMVDAVTDYVARRLLERDKALAAEARARSGPRDGAPPRAAARERAPARERPAAPVRWAGIAFAFLIDLLGAIAFFLILGGVAWYLWSRAHTGS